MPPTQKYKSIVVTVTWDRLDLMKKLIEALGRQTNRDFGVVIVDNGSEDKTQEYLVKCVKENILKDVPLWVIILPENGGFALANNLAMTYAAEFLDFEYFLLLNNDTIPSPKFIKDFHRSADYHLRGQGEKDILQDRKLFPFLSRKNDWKVGSFAPLVINYYAKDRVDAAGIKISPDGNAINRGVAEKTYKYQRKKEVFGPSGSAVLYLKKALVDVALPPFKTASLFDRENGTKNEGRIWHAAILSPGDKDKGLPLPIKEFFSSRYFAYFEDVDLAWRLRLRFWGCVYLPEIKILHHHSATGKSYSPFKSYFVHRNQYFNLLRDFPGRYLGLGLLHAFRRYLYLLQSIWKRKGPAALLVQNSSKLKVFTVTLRGWASVLRNLFGLLRERWQIQKNRQLTVREFKKIITCPRFRADFSRMIFDAPSFLRERRKNGDGG
ncbi:MAG: glycosyltransferase family 2 protein [Candidatus Moranbacteria bacterium]|nr:glycosyltransferase family 2 protein [Candidatus Moranbacteria bacterium]